MNIRQTEHDLTKYARNFLEQTYGMKLEIPIKVNGRIKRTAGRFRHYSGGGASVDIEISKDHILYNSIEDILDTLRHELTHYALYEQGRDFDDGDEDFENELIKNNATSTMTKSYKTKGHLYNCTDCGAEVFQIRRFDVNRYRCASCRGGKLEYVGQSIQ